MKRLLGIALSLLAGFATAYAQTPPALAGRYFLSGVMEVGSEMELKADGSFDWFLAYGNMDKIGKGDWESDDKTVTLRFRNVHADEPAFRLIGQGPWDAEAQQMILEMRYNDALSAAGQRCSFIGYFGQTAGDDPGGPAGAGVDATIQASPAYAKALAARTKMEAAGQNRLDGKATDEDIQAAAQNWSDAYYGLQDFARARGINAVAMQKPSLPAPCREPEPVQASAMPRSQWSPGLLARTIADPSDGERTGYIPVSGIAFKLADGRILTDNVRPEGLLLIPGIQSHPVQALIVKDTFGTGETLTFPVQPMTSGVITLGVNVGKMIEPAVSTMALRIDKKGLYSEDLRGTYVRANEEGK